MGNFDLEKFFHDLRVFLDELTEAIRNILGK